MHRSLIALGLLAALAVPAAAATDSPNLLPIHGGQTQPGFDYSAGVDTTTTGSITPDASVRVNAPTDANAAGSLQRGDQSTLFGSNR